jgi:hypothetical protein
VNVLYKFIGKPGKMYEIKLNYKCPEHNGSWTCDALENKVDSISIKNKDLSYLDKIIDKLSNAKTDITNKQLKELRDNEIRIFNDLSEKEKRVIYDYTTTYGYKNVNIKKDKNINKILDSAISKSFISPGSLLWKGINLNISNLPIEPGDINKEFIISGFSSATASLSVASYFSKMDKNYEYYDNNAKEAIIEIRFPEGGNGLLLSNNHTANENHNFKVFEVILPRNQRYKLISYNKGNPDKIILDYVGGNA